MANKNNRQFAIKTPLGKKALLFVEMAGSEELGRMFHYELVLYSKRHDLAADDILGQNVTVEMLGAEAAPRFFNGYVTAFSQVGTSLSELAIYRATLSPWLWFLTRTADCRIFQEQSVVDIIKSVFSENGFSEVEDALCGNYSPREYCVQYRESDFDFVSRLMEEEGIYYFFRHEDGAHHLVMADDPGSHDLISGDSKLPFHPPGKEQTMDKEHVSHWLNRREVQSGSYVLRDYDFKKPKKNLLVNSAIEREYAEADREVFDYPGRYSEAADGEQLAQRRIEQLQVSYEQIDAQTDARFIATGGLFVLTDHPRDDGEYLVVRTSCTLESDEYASGSRKSARPYACEFLAVKSKTPFRAARTSSRPCISGPQTAVVVGDSGEEIYVDDLGRVKVQFHWDRYGGSDENSSCWIRVAQSWAGAGWGAQFLPRIGQEVIVEFLEGDPDRPIITGAVYNALNKYPYGLPASKTRSGIRSRSTKGAGAANFNEIRFEDKKGSEELFVHAEKDYRQEVKHDRSETVGNDRALEVGKNKTEKVGESSTSTIGKKYLLEVGEEITIKTGAASITMKKDGSIIIAGKDIQIKGSGAIDIKASSKITMKGSKILQN